MEGIPYQELLDAGVHFGHLKKKWNPKMLPYIFMEKKGIHIIDLNRTNEGLLRSANAMKAIVRSGGDIMFVATKKQAREIVKEAAESVGMPFITERWLGGMMTNFNTIRKSIKKMKSIETTLSEGGAGLTKKERLMLTREQEKLNRVLGGIANLNSVPKALYIVDITHEHIALAEAKKLNVTTFGMVDTNSDPTTVDFAVPANDDASKSVAIITAYLTNAIREGIAEREIDMQEKAITQADEASTEENVPKKRRARGSRRRNKSQDSGSGS